MCRQAYQDQMPSAASVSCITPATHGLVSCYSLLPRSRKRIRPCARHRTSRSHSDASPWHRHQRRPAQQTGTVDALRFDDCELRKELVHGRRPDRQFGPPKTRSRTNRRRPLPRRCPSVKVITVGGSDKMALGDDCTFNRYDGPIVSD